MYNCMRTTKTNRFNSQYGRNTISDDIKYKNIKKESLHTISQYLISVPGTLLQKKAHFKLCKYSIKVRKKATNRAVMGELGRYPLFLKVLLNMIKIGSAYLKLILHQLYYLSVYSFQKPYINKTKKLVCKH